MKLRKYLVGIFAIFALSIVSLTAISSEDTYAAAVDFEAVITNYNTGNAVTNVLKVDDQYYYGTNGYINCSAVVGKEITVYVSANHSELPDKLTYVCSEAGFVIPFIGALNLNSVEGSGANSRGVYTGKALSYVDDSFDLLKR